MTATPKIIPLVATTDKIIGVSFYEEHSRNLLSKQEKKPAVLTLKCRLDGECPLLKRGECVHRTLFGRGCLYGHEDWEYGPSKRAKSYYEFCKSGREKDKEGLPLPDHKHGDVMEVIGGYVYLPYSHMDMCKEVPFFSHSLVLLSGMPFLLLENFTIANILALVRFRPYALSGGEIIDYQNKSIPLFLLHLCIKFPELYKEAVEAEPSILNKILNLSKIKQVKARLADIEAGCTEGYTVGKGLTVLSWDGTWLELEGTKDQMSFFLAGFSGTDYRLRMRPDVKRTEVIVTDPTLMSRLIFAKPYLVGYYPT